MKKILSVALLFVALNSIAQDKTYPTPDYNNTPFYYDAAKNELVELDANQFVVGARPKGLTGAEAALYIDETTSRNKIKKNSATFIVKLQPSIDPRTLIDLNKATVNQKSSKHKFIIYKKKIFTTKDTNPTIEITFKKIGDGIYLVTKKSELSNNEYFFSLTENSKSQIIYYFTIN